MGKEEDLVPLFVPALSATLISAEDKKGSPLEESEVLDIRDNAAVIMMKREDALKMDDSRGYKDIDPENCWYDWQMLRRELGRKPDLDPGAKFSYVSSKDDEFQKTIDQAQKSLGRFREFLRENSGDELFPLVKVLLSEPDYHAYMWLVVRSSNENSFLGEIFELPSEFKTYEVGMQLDIPNDEVQDWMINDNGTLYGGYSLRYNRERMNEAEQVAFDQHIGVERYA